MGLTDLTGVTGVMVKLALDAANVRHLVIANNIANANTPGYAPQRVEFEQQLAAAVRDGRVRAHSALLEGVRPVITVDPTAPGPSGSRVQLDTQAAQLAQNVVHYQALLQGMRGQRDILQLAITEGKM
jgi:flagellar basal-body rod protein FlgB